MYYYSTVNGIIMTHSALLEKDGFDIVKVHFERPNEDGFDFLDMTLPGEIVYKSFGFSEDEILKLKRYAKNNSSLIWDFALKGGGENGEGTDGKDDYGCVSDAFEPVPPG